MSEKSEFMRIGRRQFLKVAAGAASLSVLAACTPAAPTVPVGAPTGAPTTAPETAAAPTDWRATLPDNLNGKTGPAQSGGVIVVDPGGSMTVPHFSPFRSPGGPHAFALAYMGSRLITRGFYNDGLHYDLAESHEEVEKGRVFDIKLRQNAKWHDGHPVTADDIVYTYYLWAHKDVAQPVDLSIIKGAKDLKENGGGPEKLGVTKIDDYTVRFELEEPVWYWTAMALFEPAPMVPAHILSQMTPDKVYEFSTQMPPIPYSGPFKFKQYVQDQYLEMERFDDYYLGKPYLDGMIMRLLASDALDAALEVGDVHVGPASNIDAWARLGALPDLDAIAQPLTNVSSPKVNANRFPEFRLALQKALVLAVDRQTICRDILKGAATPVDWLHHNVPWLNPPPADLKTYPYDPAQAKAVLEEAGWDFNQELKWYAWYAPSPTDSFMLQQYADIGLKIVWDQRDTSQIMETLYEKDDFDVIMETTTSRLNVFNALVQYGCNQTYQQGGWNVGGFCDPHLDELYTEMNRLAIEGTEEEFNATAIEIGKYWNEVLPSSLLWLSSRLWVYNKKVNAPVPFHSIHGQAWTMPLEKVWLSS